MARTNRYTIEQVCEALEASHGLLSMAATRLGCSSICVSTYLARYPAIKECQQRCKDAVTDLAEDKLYQAVKQGKAWAICFYLKTQGKSRGYIERQEVTGEGGGPVLIKEVVMVRPGEKQ